MDRFAQCIAAAATGGVTVPWLETSYPAEYRMNPGASDRELEAVKARVGHLPDDLRAFYRRWNGGELLRTVGQGAYDSPVLWFVRAQDLWEQRLLAASVWGEKQVCGLILITRDGMGNWVGMLPDGRLIDCDHDYPPRVWLQRVFEERLEDFLVRLHRERRIWWFERWV